MKRFVAAALLVPLLLASLRSEPQANSVKIGKAKVVTSGPTVAQPHAAFGDGVYLVVWQDGWTGVDATADIKGIRLQAGTLEPLDKEPITICAAADAQEAPVVAYANGKGSYLFAWVKGMIAKDRLNLSNLDIWVRGMDAKTLEVRVADSKAAATDADETRPVLVNGPAGEILLLYERLKSSEARRIEARWIGTTD